MTMLIFAPATIQMQDSSEGMDVGSQAIQYMGNSPSCVFTDICWHPNGEFAIAVGEDGGDGVVYRYHVDDETWTEIPHTHPAGAIYYGVDYSINSGNFVIVGNPGGPGYSGYYTDGYSNIARIGTFDSKVFLDVAIDNYNNFIAAGMGGDAYYWDGSWEPITDTPSGDTYTSVTYNGSHYFIMGYDSGNNGVGYYTTSQRLLDGKFSARLILDTPEVRLNGVAWNYNDATYRGPGAGLAVGNNGAIFKFGNPEVYENPNPQALGPPLEHFSMDFDTYNQKTVMFGGSYTGNRANCLDMTWVYDSLTNEWTDMNPSNPPTERFKHDMCYDSKHGVFIMFGGRNGVSDYMGLTWEYNLTTNTWTNRNPQGQTPSPRMSNKMVYDPINDKTLMFGGSVGTYVNSVWAYDYESNTWTNMNPGGQTPAVSWICTR